jgi:hypothetical protein
MQKQTESIVCSSDIRTGASMINSENTAELSFKGSPCGVSEPCIKEGLAVAGETSVCFFEQSREVDRCHNRTDSLVRC